MKKFKDLEEVVKQLEGAVEAHGQQAKTIKKHINEMKKPNNSPALRKLSASCKAAAKRKFDVYPSAYANMWASKQQGKGKC